MSKIDLVIDLQFGSTGKGLLAGYLAETVGYDMVVTANMPNAGHTYINKEGRRWMHKALPSGITSPLLKVVAIGPGAVFCPDRLNQEIADSWDILQSKRIIIHPNACVLNEGHRETERNSLSKISSTMQGSAAAVVQKMMRDGKNSPLARDMDKGHPLYRYVVTHAEWRYHVRSAYRILAEGAQGYSLSLNSEFWPHCTSRDCTPARFMADMGLPLGYLNKVIGTARCHPIRVGNTSDGYSGNPYSDQLELSWEELGQKPELTTVTQRVRRVFSFSIEQMENAIQDCQPDEIFLNFCNYDENLAREIANDIDVLGHNLSQKPLVRYTGHGPAFQHVKDHWAK